LDYQLFHLINEAAGHNGLLDSLMLDIARYGAFLFPAALVYLWFRPGKNKQGDYEAALLALASAAVALLIAQLIGHVYFRQRPFSIHQVTLLLDRSPDASFPSDHATFAFAIASVVWLRTRKLGWVLLAGAFILSFSRVYCGTHYPLDVTGGALLGILAGCLLWLGRSRLRPVLSFLISVLARLRLAKTPA
jgi:undecaprenyl-diphosphatase